MMESGPVAGMIGAGRIAQILGIERAIGFDMGGTTAKTSLITERRAADRGGLCHRRRVLPASRCNCRSSTSSKSAPAAARSPGATSAAGCMSGRTAPGPIRVRPATAAAAPSRPSPTPIFCSDASTMRVFSAATCGSTARARTPPLGEIGQEARSRRHAGSARHRHHRRQRHVACGPRRLGQTRHRSARHRR